MDELIMFKALNGEEVIARLVEEGSNSDVITIERARVLSMQPGAQPGQVTIAMIPWYLGAPDGTVDVYKAHIFSRLQTIPLELAKGYMQQTSSIALV